MLNSDALPPRPRLLVTGASGFLGWHLCQAAQADWQVFGTTYSQAVQVPGCSMVKLDLRDFASLQQMLRQVQPDAVIHAAAQARPQICQAAPQASFAINVEASGNLAGLCADLDIPLVFVSTDLVFDGLHPPYAESDPVSPVNCYGEQKVAAELGIRKRYPSAIIGRLPLMYGVVPHAASFIQPLIQTLQAGQTLQLFTDEFRTPVSGADAARGLMLALSQGQGCWHLGGPTRLSRYEIGQVLARLLGYPETQLLGCFQREVVLTTPRPGDVSLDSSLAFGLGYAPSTVVQALSPLLGQY